MPAVNRKEWLWALVWSGLILLVSSLPYLYGAMLSTAETQFSGFVIGLEDGHSYLAKMQQGRAGYWLFRLSYTPEPHRAEPFFLFYIILGKVARLVRLSNPVLFHLARLATVPVGLLVFYFFAAYFADTLRVRRLAFLIFGLTGGLGWLWLVLGGIADLGRMPVDLWVPDASFFLSALTFPHLPLAQGLLLLLSLAGLEFVRRGQTWVGVAAATCGLLVSLIHPHTLPVISVILGLYILWRHYDQRQELLRRLVRLGLIILPSLPYLIYVGLVFVRNPVFVIWRSQSLTYSPAPVHYLLGFGVTLVLAVVGIFLTWKPASPKYRFLQVWAVSVPVLVYLPLALQRRFLDGYQAPLAVLAAVGLAGIVTRIRRPFWQRVVVILTLLFMSLTNLLLVTGAMATIRQRSAPVFIDVDEVEAAAWLAGRVEQSVVVASYEVGNYLPTVADARVFIGHGPETADSETKKKLLDRFFGSGDNGFRQQLLHDYDVAYVFYGPRERQVGDFRPAAASYLQPVYDNGTVQIFQVVGAGEQ